MSNSLNFTTVSDGSRALMQAGSSMYRSVPEPRSESGSWAFMKNAAAAIGNALPGAAGLAGATDIPGLLNKQIEIQLVMQVVSMESNIARSKHETEMAPIRNMRIG